MTVTGDRSQSSDNAIEPWARASIGDQPRESSGVYSDLLNLKMPLNDVISRQITLSNFFSD
jgi:hypothetical protein